RQRRSHLRLGVHFADTGPALAPGAADVIDQKIDTGEIKAQQAYGAHTQLDVVRMYLFEGYNNRLTASVYVGRAAQQYALSGRRHGILVHALLLQQIERFLVEGDGLQTTVLVAARIG